MVCLPISLHTNGPSTGNKEGMDIMAGSGRNPMMELEVKNVVIT